MSPDPTARRFSERLFAALTKLFPTSFRDRFGQDMRELFRDQVSAARGAAGWRGELRLWTRVLPSFVHAAALEHRYGRRARRRETSIVPSPARKRPMFEMLRTDVRLAGRMIRRNRSFALVSVLCVAIGTGSVTTIFSAMNALMLRPLPGTTDGSRLLLLERKDANGREGVSGSYHLYEVFRDRAATLEGVAAWSKVDLAIGTATDAQAVYGNIVSASFFNVLGVRPAMGRFFSADEDRTLMGAPVVVVSYGFWKSRLGADPDAIGRTLSVNGHPYTLIGVTPSGFRGVFTPLKADAWVPLSMQPQLRPGRDLADAPWLWLFGRTRPGIARQAAVRELSALTAEHARNTPDPNAYRQYDRILASPLTGLPSDARTALFGFAGLLMAAGSLVLLIASVNVASLLSARGLARSGELAVRAALGAGRWRLAAQLLTEVVVLFLLGGAGGVLVAFAATRALEQVSIPGSAPILLELTPDLRVLAFALAVALITGVVFGLPSALAASNTSLTGRLRTLAVQSSPRRRWLSQGLIVGQLALSLVLLVAAGLFGRALIEGGRVDPGFDVSGVVVVPLNTQAWGYDTQRARAFYEDLRERIAALPGTVDVTTTDIVPLSASSSGATIQIPGAGQDGRVPVRLSAVGPDYFSVVRIRIVSGRPIGSGDDDRAPRVAVVNETLARRYWPDGTAVGRTFGQGGQQITIVGVAANAKYATLDETPPAFVYLSMAQTWRPDQTLMVRTSLPAGTFGGEIQQVVRSIDRSLPRPAVSTLERETSIVLLPQRVAAIVTGLFGATGLLLGSIGLYGVLGYAVTRRTREIGVRLALGATRTDVLASVVGDGMRLALAGIGAGLLLAAACTRFIASFLFTVSPLDVTTFAATSAVFVAVALVACYFPARRAAACDPLTALRAD